MASEDLSTYTEVDPGGAYLALSDGNTTVIVGQLPQNKDARIFKDFTADYFGLDFSVTWRSSTLLINGVTDVGCRFAAVTFANDIDDIKGLSGAGKSYLAVMFSRSVAGFTAWIEESNAGVLNLSDVEVLPVNNAYYTFERDDEAGTATLSAYSDSVRETLVFTTTLTLNGEHDFRYFYTANSYNSGDTEVITLTVHGPFELTADQPAPVPETTNKSRRFYSTRRGIMVRPKKSWLKRRAGFRK